MIDVAKINIGHGAHDKPIVINDDTKVCALEWVSILAGEEEFSDHPRCACPVIATFVRESALLVRRFDLYHQPRNCVATVVLALNTFVLVAFVACAAAFVAVVIVEGRVVQLLEFVVLYLVIVPARFMAADASMCMVPDDRDTARVQL